MALNPVPMSAQELRLLLLHIADSVAEKDSFGGSIEYDALGGPPCDYCGGSGVSRIVSDGPEDVCPGCGGFGVQDLPAGKDFWVHGVYRVGNSMGQGSVRMIGEVQS